MYNEKTIEKLKQKILDLAIRGKLVQQDPSDEPASILIEKIRKEKEKLIKEGKIKKPKEDSFIFKGSDNCYYENVNGKIKNIQDEIPFEIPESWCWCRLRDIGSYDGGFTPNKNDLNKDKTGLPYFKVADMNTIENQLFLSKTDVYCSKYNRFYLKNSIVFPKNGGALFTNKKRILAQNSIVDLNTGIYTLYYKGILEFVFLFFNLIDFSKIYKGSSVPTIDSNKFLKIFIPIPSLNEQIKIINKYEVIFNQINDILISSRDFSIIKNRIKSKVLNLIFNQNSSYKSYYENRISTNLEEYIGKSDIGDGDWVLSENMDDKGNIKLVQLKHIGSGNYIDKPYCKINNSFFEQNKCSEIKEDYLLINRLVSDKMNVCIMPNIQSKCITSIDVCWIKPNKKYLTKYLMYYLMAPCFQKEVLNLCSGSTRKRISKKNLIKIPMLIHSFKDQKEIVKKIDNIFTLIDNM